MTNTERQWHAEGEKKREVRRALKGANHQRYNGYVSEARNNVRKIVHRALALLLDKKPEIAALKYLDREFSLPS